MKVVLFTAWYLLLAAGCLGSDDEDDDAEDCVSVRSKYIAVNVHRARLAQAGEPTESTDLLLAEYMNRHWECFK